MRTSLILALSFCFLGLNAQKIEVPDHQYLFSETIRGQLANEEMRTARGAQNLSYIGAYQAALSVPNEVDFEWGFDSLTRKDIDYFKTFEAVNAVDGILEKTKKEQIVIINEAHHFMK